MPSPASECRCHSETDEEAGISRQVFRNLPLRGEDLVRRGESGPGRAAWPRQPAPGLLWKLCCTRGQPPGAEWKRCGERSGKTRRIPNRQTGSLNAPESPPWHGGTAGRRAAQGGSGNPPARKSGIVPAAPVPLPTVTAMANAVLCTACVPRALKSRTSWRQELDAPPTSKVAFPLLGMALSYIFNTFFNRFPLIVTTAVRAVVARRFPHIVNTRNSRLQQRARS